MLYINPFSHRTYFSYQFIVCLHAILSNKENWTRIISFFAVALGLAKTLMLFEMMDPEQTWLQDKKKANAKSFPAPVEHLPISGLRPSVDGQR